MAEQGAQMATTFELYYWPSIPGRGEFVRLALEYGGAQYSTRYSTRYGVRYVDVARKPGGTAKMVKLMGDKAASRPPFAPPFLKAGKQVIAQTANILLYLGPKLGLAPKDEAGRLWVHQVQLTIADFMNEVHDTHHPVGVTLYYEQQKREAKRRALDFRTHRMPKYLGYFEHILERNGGRVAGRATTYADLSLFQVVAGLRYAFPLAMKSLERSLPRMIELHDRIAELPQLSGYLGSKRRIAFNKDGIFRNYPELDGGVRRRS
jgi:glutathione S-transferase